MQKTVDKYLLKFFIYSALLFAGVLLLLVFAACSAFPSFALAYGLSFIFVGSNFLVMRKIDLNDQSRFVRIFGWSLAVRFVLVIAAIIGVLITQNNHQIFFTVSFIISYICHSVIEIIFLNKILETETEIK